MGARSGTALKFLQWFVRAVQFACSAIILGIFSYFLATLHNHSLHIPTSTRAVEGISGAATLYTLIGLVTLCCLAGLMFTSLIAIILDVAFIGAFIYVAYANRAGAGSCRGNIKNTPFGSGLDNTYPKENSDGFTNLPSFHTACRLQTACLAVAIIGIFFFIFSIIIEVALVRSHRKEKRFGPGPQNDYTSGYGSRGGVFKRLFSRRRKANPTADENALPAHTTPDQLDGNNRYSYATGTTAAQNDNAYNPEHSKYETGYGYQPGTGITGAGHDAGHVKTGNDTTGYTGATYETTHTGAGYNTNPAGTGHTGYHQTTYQQASTLPQQQQNYRYNDGVYDRS